MISILKIFLIPICFFGWFKDNRSEAEKTFDQVLSQGINLIQKKYNLEILGSGGGMPDGFIHNFNISFKHYGVLPIEKARGLLVNVTTDFLQVVNSNPKIRNYLYTFPFKGEDISLMILIKSSDGDDLEDPFLGSMCQCRGSIRYETLKYLKTNLFPKTIKQTSETYDEAVQILKEQ
ncbi:hypothetical protein BN1013_00736 [Candidatus Rubidus massiliensis]|nr:MAG: hypothetical protein BGO10_09800 [Chlamydia sp. 32-24]CDZ80229.1 hypothetical protein BN1013_00736 [Candidatus Rubidus massiliensis]